MEISINGSLPDVNNYKINEKQFCSFKYESVIDVKKTNTIDNSKTETEKNSEIEMNFLESLEGSDNFDNTDSEYESANENDYNNQHLENDENIKIVTKPINIRKSNNNTDVNDFEFILNQNDKSSNEFEIIYPDEFRPTSLPLNNKTITESFRDYLYSSISLIKQSYNYISSNKSI